MATSLGQLLDTLTDTARTTEDSPRGRADAAAAVGHLGRALNRLGTDGVSAALGDRRERHLIALATACTELGARAPLSEDRLSELAAASADLVGTMRETFTVAGRWAAAVEITDVLAPLAEVVGQGLSAGPAAHLLAVVERSAVLVEQAAAQDPPTRAGAAQLDHPVPARPTSPAVKPAEVLMEGIAELLQATAARSAEPPSIAEVLAFTLAAQSLTTAASRLITTKQGAGKAVGEAAEAWRGVRIALRPFGDGSRRRHSHAPPAVQAAGRLHTMLSREAAQSEVWSRPPRAAVAAAAQHLPALAVQLDRVVQSWGRTGTLLAYAVDLPTREDRMAEALRGHRIGGVVRADALDLSPVRATLHAAEHLSAVVAARTVGPSAPAAANFPRRSWAAHRAFLEQPSTDAALRGATQQAQAHLAVAPGRPPGPRRSR